MGNADDWGRLARLLDDDEEVAAGVATALQQGDDPWEALLDGLDEAGALAYLQADDTGMELTDALAQLPRVFAAQPDLNGATDVDELPAATRTADVELAEHGLRIVRLVEDDDSWPLIVLPQDRVEDVVAAAAALGHRVEAAG